MNDNEFMIPVAFIIGVAHYISPDPASSERTFQWKTNTVIIKP